MTNMDNNPIGFLQELSQKHILRLPKYEDIGSSGPDHCKEFTVKCDFEGLEAKGVSQQKKLAKTEAAREMIRLLREKNYFEKLNPKNELANAYELATNHVFEKKSELSVTSLGSKNPISVLNEFCQKKSLRPPNFVETSAEGLFICECNLNDKKTYGNGINKKSAKTEAALKMCIEFNLKCSGQDYVLRQSQMACDFKEGKNPVSALQEHCSQSILGKNVEYIEMSPENNIFVIKCVFDSISCEGRGTSKKLAKAEAARQVLGKLSGQSANADGQFPPVSALSKILTTVPKTHVSSSGPNVHGILKDFNLDSSEEEDEDSKKAESSSEVDVNLRLKLEVLSLEPEHALKDVPDIKSEETNQAQGVPDESS